MSVNPMLALINNTKNNNQLQLNPQIQMYKEMLRQLQTAQNPQLILQQMLNQTPGLKQALEIARLGNGDIVEVAKAVANQTGNNLEQVLKALQN